MMVTAERATWQNWRVLATLTSVFLCGAVVGALSMRSGLHNILHRSATTYWKDTGNQLSYERLTRELNLTPQQAEQLRSILDDMVKYHQDLQQQIDDVRATGKNRILQLLNPDQRQRSERISKEQPAR